MSQGQVAKLMKIHRPTVSEIEAGRRRVSAEELSTFAELYGVSVAWLTSENEEALDASDDKLLMAARRLSAMKDEDLDRLMSIVSMLRKTEGKNDPQ